jgi:hypothetical protein
MSKSICHILLFAFFSFVYYSCPISAFSCQLVDISTNMQPTRRLASFLLLYPRTMEKLSFPIMYGCPGKKRYLPRANYDAVPEDGPSSRKIISISNEYACTSSEKQVSGWLPPYSISVPIMFYYRLLWISVRFGLPETLSNTHLTFLSIRNLDIHSSQFKAKLTCSRESLRLSGKSQTF